MATALTTAIAARGDVDPRVAELEALVATEGVKIANVDMILWYEDRGYVVDLETGVAMKVTITGVTRSGIAVNHLLSPVTDQDVERTVNSLFSATSEECAPEGTLQAMIDAADEDSWYDARLQELRDDMEFGDFVRGHC